MSEIFDNLLGQGVAEPVAKKLDEIHKKGVLNVEDLDDRAIEALKEFPDDDANNILDQFAKSDLSHVQNKSAFLCGVMKTYRAKLKNKAATEAASSTSALPAAAPSRTPQEPETSKQTGPHEEKVKELLDRTGYTLDITTGQRKYGGPPPNWEGPVPGTGEKKFCSQIFIGKIPRDMYEDELVPMFEKFGEMYDLRIMVDPFTGLNKGFAFCTFTTKEAAQAAVKEMEGKKVRGGKGLGVCLSQANNRLFVGSIPKSKTKDQIFNEFSNKVECLSDVIVYTSSEDKTKNRGFAFLEFSTHKDAALARRKLMSGRIKVFGNITPTVDWADPVVEPDDETMAKVKVVYVKNLAPSMEETKLNELFKQYGPVEKVKKIKDYAFIHFANRDDAVRAIEELNGQEIDDLKVELSLAKPLTDKKDRRGQSGFGSLNQNNRGDRGAQGGRGGFTRGGRGRGGFGNFGPSQPYGGGYGGYDDSSYDAYYGMPPVPRGRGGMRGGARGGMRGGSMRGGGMRLQGAAANAPRGAPRGGARGGRGGAPRGGAGGRGMARGGRGAMAPKRKMDGYGAEAYGKRKYGAESSGGNWNPQPIAQQPLKEGRFYDNDYATSGGEWYQDNYGTEWK